MNRLLFILFSLLMIIGCSDDPKVPPIPSPPMISDVGEFVRAREINGIEVSIYTYEGVVFDGDLLLSDWEWFSNTIEDQLQPEEPFYKVTNFLLYPEILQHRGVQVKTCTDPRDESCFGGHWWSFGTTIDGWGMIGSGGWVLFP